MANTQEDVQRALNLSYFYLKFRPRTRYEVKNYLLKKSEKIYHWEEVVIDTTLDILEGKKFIDDLKFVESFVETRSIIRPKSEFVLRQELLKLGVDKNILDIYFSENILSENDLAQKALLSRWSAFLRLDKKSRFQKAVQFLQRRGFSFSVAKNAISTLEDKEM